MELLRPAQGPRVHHAHRAARSSAAGRLLPLRPLHLLRDPRQLRDGLRLLRQRSTDLLEALGLAFGVCHSLSNHLGDRLLLLRQAPVDLLDPILQRRLQRRQPPDQILHVRCRRHAAGASPEEEVEYRRRG